MTRMSPAALLAQWHDIEGLDVYRPYLTSGEPTAGLVAIHSPAPAEGSPVNWLNIFYAIEWAVFAGFAFYLWYRLARDAWEREVEEFDESEPRHPASRLEPMPAAPKLATFPAIRGALKFYQVASIITGTMLLLLCAEMIVKYLLGYELFLGGSGGFLWFAPVVEGRPARSRPATGSTCRSASWSRTAGSTSSTSSRASACGA